jgi:hypothetical protein
MSANPLSQTKGYYTYNFTTDAFKAYGLTTPQKEIGSGVFGMYGGDMNADGLIGSQDKNSWAGDSGKGGYLSTDATLDGQTDNKDKNSIAVENTGKASLIPE